MLKKHITVLRLEGPSHADESVLFTNHDSDSDPDGVELFESLVISRDQWEDMGGPKAITMTLQPGDLLN